MKFILLDELYSLRNYSWCFVSRSQNKQLFIVLAEPGKSSPYFGAFTTDDSINNNLYFLETNTERAA
jgi:hypothetical protein